MSMELITAICVIVGVLISLGVSAAKRITFVANNPKLIAMVVSVITAVVLSMLGVTDVAAETGAMVEQPDTWKMIALCAVEQFTAAVAAYETVIKPMAARGDGPNV